MMLSLLLHIVPEVFPESRSSKNPFLLNPNEQVSLKLKRKKMRMSKEDRFVFLELNEQNKTSCSCAWVGVLITYDN